MASLPTPTPDANPLAPIAPASGPERSESIESAVAEPVIVGTDGEEYGADLKRSRSRALRPNADWWPWYAAAIGLLLMLFGGGRSTEALLISWSIAGIVMIALPLVHAPAALRMRLTAAAVVFLVPVLAAWRLDADPGLGVLALAGNGRALVALAALTAILGGLTASRRWIVLQSGVWFAALAISGWSLLLASDSQGLLATWQELLPYKQVEFSSKTFAFGTADALLLSILPVGGFAICAYAGSLIRSLVEDDAGAFPLSKIQAIAVAATIGALLIAVKTSDEFPVALIVMLAIVWGVIVRSLGDVVRISVAVAGVAIAFAAQDVASRGLLDWWGPHYCNDFVGYDCMPSQQAPWVIFSLALLPIIIALTYGAKRLLGRLFGRGDGDFVEL